MNARGGGCPLFSCYPFSFVYIDNDTNFQRNIASIFFDYIKIIQSIQGKYIYFDQFSEDQHLPSLPPPHISILTIWKVVTFFFNYDFWIGLLLFKNVPVLVAGKNSPAFYFQHFERVLRIQIHQKLTFVYLRKIMSKP